MRLYLDANVFVHSVIDDGVRGEKARELFVQIAHGDFEAVTSTLTMDEIVWVICSETKNRELSIMQGFRFLQLAHIRWIPVGKEEVSYALLLMQKYALRPRDAIHAAVALSSQCSSIVTDDADFDQVKEIKRKKLD